MNLISTNVQVKHNFGAASLRFINRKVVYKKAVTAPWYVIRV